VYNVQEEAFSEGKSGKEMELGGGAVIILQFVRKNAIGCTLNPNQEIFLLRH